MHHPSNILNYLESSFAWKGIRYFLPTFLQRKEQVYQKSISKPKRPIVNSKFITKSSRSPIINLELRKNHPLFMEKIFRIPLQSFKSKQIVTTNNTIEALDTKMEHHFEFFWSEVESYGKKKSH